MAEKIKGPFYDEENECKPPTEDELQDELQRMLKRSQEEGFEQIEKYPDDQKLLITTIQNELLIKTAGELKEELTNIKPDSPLYLREFYIIDDKNPEQKINEINKRAEKERQDYLKMLEDFARQKNRKPYKDNEIIWFVRNPRKFLPEKTTAGKYRSWFVPNDTNYDHMQDLAAMGGIRILSDDPNFDPEKWAHEYSEKLWKDVQEIVLSIEAIQNIKEKLLELLNQDKSSEILIQFPYNPEQIRLTKKEAQVFIRELTKKTIEEKGVPTINQKSIKLD